MKRRFDYFQYKLPAEPAEYFIDQAVPILRLLKERFPQLYEKNFRCPSQVLTLSGVRAFDTYYDFGKDTTDEEINSIKDLLKEQGVLVLTPNMSFMGEDAADQPYSLLHTDTLRKIPGTYGYVPAWRPLDTQRMANDVEFVTWWLLWKEEVLYLADAANREDEPPIPIERWLRQDVFAAHNITFGMLLGYPGEAICSLLEAGRVTEGDGRILWSSPKHVAAFDGAHPSFSYLAELQDNPNIKAHQQLWSDILDGVYVALGEQVDAKTTG